VNTPIAVVVIYGEEQIRASVSVDVSDGEGGPADERR
jgi:hypothetical protein